MNLNAANLAQAMQSLKQGVARRLALRAADSFWQARYYDFNVWSEHKFVEKLRYIHRNPVKPRLGGAPGGLSMEQFPSLCQRRDGSGRDRVSVDGSATRALGNFSYAKDDGAARKTPPKLSLSGHPRSRITVGWASPRLSTATVSAFGERREFGKRA